MKSRIGMALKVLYPGEFDTGTGKSKRKKGFIHKRLSSVKKAFDKYDKVKMILSTTVILFILVVVYSLYAYNKFITHVNNIYSAVASMENEKQRRNDLINNLVPPTINYLVFERELFTHVAEIRKELTTLDKFIDKKPTDLKLPESLLGQMPSLTGIFENYPDLKASKQFSGLMKELIETENRIAAARILFNKEINIHNTYITTIPSSWVAYLFRYKVKDWFVASEAASHLPDMKQLDSVNVSKNNLPADLLDKIDDLLK